MQMQMQNLSLALALCMSVDLSRIDREISLMIRYNCIVKSLKLSKRYRNRRDYLKTVKIRLYTLSSTIFTQPCRVSEKFKSRKAPRILIKLPNSIWSTTLQTTGARNLVTILAATVI